MRRRLLAGAAALAVSACTSSKEASPMDPDISRPTGQFLTVGSTRLHYRVLGTGPKVIAIHGASGNLRDWTLGPAQALARGHSVLVIDRPGHGFSQRAPENGGDPSVQAGLMRAAAEQLGFGRAMMIGHSYGGTVALAWALDAPQTVSGLMLLAAPSQVWPGGLGLLNGLNANPVTGPVLSRLLPVLVPQGLKEAAVARIFRPQSPPPRYLERVDADLALRPQTVRANAEDLSELKRHIRSYVPRYPGLPMPVEILHGTADRTVPIDIHSDKLADQIPDAVYTRLDGIGHMPHHVATGAMLEALARLRSRI